MTMNEFRKGCALRSELSWLHRRCRVLGLNPVNLFACHSREGGNPAKRIVPQGGQKRGFVPLLGCFLTIWIPAFAGMTQLFAGVSLGLNQADQEQQLKIAS